MMKKIPIFLLLIWGLAYGAIANACSQALPTNDVNFCTSFKAAASCHCTENGVPSIFCKDVNFIYNTMISVYGTVEKACRSQSDVNVQTCMDDWQCFRTGGKDSKGRPCSNSGKKCPL